MTANPAKQNAIKQARQLYATLNGNHSAHAFLEDVKAFRARFAEHLGENPEPGNPESASTETVNTGLTTS